MLCFLLFSSLESSLFNYFLFQVTEATRMHDNDLQELKNLGNRAGIYVHDVTRFYSRFHTTTYEKNYIFLSSPPDFFPVQRKDRYAVP